MIILIIHGNTKIDDRTRFIYSPTENLTEETSPR